MIFGWTTVSKHYICSPFAKMVAEPERPSRVFQLKWWL